MPHPQVPAVRSEVARGTSAIDSGGSRCGGGGLLAPARKAAFGQAQEDQGLERRFRSRLGPPRSGGKARPHAHQHGGQIDVAVAFGSLSPHLRLKGDTVGLGS
jgi:hypothetical protein